MKNIKKLEQTLLPFYNQFEQLGVLYEDRFLSNSFLRLARKAFAKQYFFELKLLFKAENRVLRHDFKIVRNNDKQKFKAEWREIRRQYKQQRQEVRKALKEQKAELRAAKRKAKSDRKQVRLNKK